MKLSLMALACGLFLVVGLPLAAIAGPEAGGPDGDGDGVEDAFDNCTEEPNADQADADHDACGDACDLPGGSADIACDFDGNNAVGISDFVLLRGDFGCSVSGGDPECPIDCDDNDATGISDFVRLRAQFGNKLGPSGVTTANRDLQECPLEP